MNHDVSVNSTGTSQTCYEWWPEGSVTTLITEQRDATMPVRAADAPPAVPLGLLGIPLTQENAPSRGGPIRICILTSLIVANTCSTRGRLETHVPVSISSRPGRRRRGHEGHLFLFYFTTSMVSLCFCQCRCVGKGISRIVSASRDCLEFFFTFIQIIFPRYLEYFCNTFKC